MASEFSEALERFKEKLREKGLKYTRQREIIVQAIEQSGGHFTPEGLKEIVAKRFKRGGVGAATIYRTLAILEEARIVTSVSFGANGKKYEFGLKEHHDHMICDLCGEMIEFCDEEIERRQESIAAAHGFKILGHAMQIRGVCANCQKA